MPSDAKPIPLSFQTLYAELLEQCMAEAFDEAFPGAGGFIAKTIKGRRYWYFQMPAGAGPKQRYVGPETPELLQRIERHRGLRQAARSRQALVSSLVRSAGLPRAPDRLGRVVEALARAGVFRLRGVLVGTIAYQTYGALLGARLPATAYTTADVDIAQFANVSHAVGEATPPMLDVLRTVDSTFRAVPHLHDHRRSVAYRAQDGLRVDFLTPNEGRATDAPKRLAALGTDAEPLRFLDFLIHDPEPAVLLHDVGVPVMVPAAQRYALHKLIVARRRIGTGLAKRSKDLLQAEGLLGALAALRPAALRAAWREAEGRGGKWPELMLASLRELDPRTRDRTLATVGRPRAVLPDLDLAFEQVAPRNDLERESVRLWARVDGRRLACLVSRAVLDEHFGAAGLRPEDRTTKVRDNRREIERLLRAKFLNDPVEDDEALILKSDDVPRLRRSPASAHRRKIE
ncbi:MAG: GSU2403 family nucleotidyltransferase fold protein [Reyranellaceae bacterium]